MGKKDPLIVEIVNLHKSEDFEGILRKICEVSESNDKDSILLLQLLTWPNPTREDLDSFSDFIHSSSISSIYSIGCGTGLLEWLMLKVIQQKKSEIFKGLIGIEIDFGWWSSSYSPPTFIPLKYVDKDFDCEKSFGAQDDLALFCYFNNLQVFLSYLEKFQGNFVAILGPISTFQFCAPGPLELVENEEMPRENWELISFKPFGIGDVNHFAIYKRK